MNAPDGKEFALRVSLGDKPGTFPRGSQARGRPALIAFIYTPCHHVCPLIFDSVGAVQARARGSKPQAVLVDLRALPPAAAKR